MCVLIAVNQLGFGAVVPVIALYARSFGVTQSAIGLAIAVYGLARFLVALPAGQLGDRLGRRTALAAGGLVTAAGNLLCAYAPSYGAFVGARFVAGAGAALVVTSGQIVLADITTPARRGRVMVIYHLGYVIGPIALGAAADLFGADATLGSRRCCSSWCRSCSGAWRRRASVRAESERPAVRPVPPAFAESARHTAPPTCSTCPRVGIPAPCRKFA